ncbi:MAG: hypothetical protein FJ086_16895, partial [Deltaproteobacteria bacterium]|nr:hypothetical protein [Deltaproteobacteria bacterium]
MKFLHAAALLAVAASTPALANSGGRNSTLVCSQCHGGGGVPTVTVAPSVTTALPGQSLSLVVSISTLPTQPKGGFNLKATGGTLSPGDTTVRTVGAGELTHKATKAGSGGAITFAANWTAPNTPGTYTFTALGNAVNGDFSDNGDMHGTGIATVTVTGGAGG